MALVQGKVVYDSGRTNDGKGKGIPNTTVVLQRIDSEGAKTGHTVAVNTNENGDYTFRDVPNGKYQVVVYHGYDKLPNPNSSDVLYSTNSTQEMINGGKAPPKDAVPNPVGSSTNNDFVNESTMIRDITGDWKVNTFNIGPVRYLPLKIDGNVQKVSDNLFTGLDNGTFGSFPPGTTVNSYPDANPPYSDIGTALTYEKSSGISDGKYTIQNTFFPGTGKQWWRQADKTTGNETGRAMYVNGNNPDQNVLEQTINVIPNNDYLLSAWISNIVNKAGLTNPQLTVQVLSEDGKTKIYDQPAGKEQVEDIFQPKWSEFGAVFNAGNNSKLKIRIVSKGGATDGNDYAIDDLALFTVKLPSGLAMTKESNKSTATLGETVTYTIILENKLQRDTKNVNLKDLLPPELQFVDKTVKINGTAHEDYNPNTGFKVADTMTPGQKIIVTFDAKVVSIPNPNSIVNTATATYDYNYIEENVPTSQAETGSSQPLIVQKSADLSMEVKVDKDNPRPGEEISYTITNKNAGPDTAEKPILSYTPPANITDITYSLDGGATFHDWPDDKFIQLDDIPSGANKQVIIKGKVPADSAGMINNHFAIASTTSDPTNNNFFDYGSTILPVSKVTVTKTSDKTSYLPGGDVEYTIKITNEGPAKLAENTLYVYDNVPTAIASPKYSFDNWATSGDWAGNKAVPTVLEKGQSAELKIKGALSSTASGTLENTANVVSNEKGPDGNTIDVKANISTAQITSSAKLSSAKTPDKPSYLPGEVITYTIKISNDGTASAAAPTITDTVGANVENPEYSVDGSTWAKWNGTATLAEIPAGGNATVQIRGTIAQGATGKLGNSATTTSTTPGPLSSTKTPDKPSYLPGEVITYTIKISNDGTAPAAAPTITYGWG